MPKFIGDQVHLSSREVQATGFKTPMEYDPAYAQDELSRYDKELEIYAKVVLSDHYCGPAKDIIEAHIATAKARRFVMEAVMTKFDSEAALAIVELETFVQEQAEL